MKIFIITSLVYALSLLRLSAIGAECSEAFLKDLSYYKGTKIPDWNQYPDLPNGSKVSFLGEGGFGSVYRIETGKNQSFIVKFYKRLKLGFTMSKMPESLLTFDLDALDSLQELPEWNDKPYPSWFRIVKFKRGRIPDTLELEDIQGWTLQDFLKMESIPQQTKSLILQRYGKLVEYFRSTSSGFEHKGEYDFASDGIEVLGYAAYGISPDNPILLKADNLVVESSTLNLVMIDPF